MPRKRSEDGCMAACKIFESWQWGVLLDSIAPFLTEAEQERLLGWHLGMSI